MRMSQALLKTQKQVAAEAEPIPSAQLLLRAGLARRVAAGMYSLSPLAIRVVRRIEAILREEMERLGGQEVLLPVVQPAELWRETGRYEQIGEELARLTDRNARPLVLAMTHEEAATDLVRATVESYRQLPQVIFQFQTKFRDEARPRGALIRLREFLMKDAYSYHATQEDFDAFYARALAAYERVFARIGLPVLVVRSDTGMMGGKDAHEFMLLSPSGEDTLIVCPACGYAANQEVAVAARELPDDARRERGEEEEDGGAGEPLREVATPGATTIAALGQALGVTPAETLKSVFYQAADGTLALALIRGDLDVGEIKLGNLLGQPVRALSAEEARAAGLVVGYAGPVGLRLARPALVVADESATAARPLVAGANRAGWHLAGVRYGRDYTADRVGEIARARAGDRCAQCGARLEERRGIEVGNTFKLGTRYSAAMGATFVDERGERAPMLMGSYGVGVTRLLACVVEHSHDADGIIWPASVAPYCAQLVTVRTDPAVRAAADALYAALGLDATLYDDRDLSAGAKFKDADLLGMPVRVTVSARTLATNEAELRLRRSGETRRAALDAIPSLVASLTAEADGDNRGDWRVGV